MNENVSKKVNFNQVCVWPGTICGQEKIKEFEQYILLEFGTRVQYLEEIKTLPDRKNGNDVSGTGDRNDLFFAVHTDDVNKFALPRLKAGIRWIEDAVGDWNNPEGIIYPKRVLKYKTWNDESLKE